MEIGATMLLLLTLLASAAGYFHHRAMNDALVHAASTDDREGVRKALAWGADPNARGPERVNSQRDTWRERVRRWLGLSGKGQRVCSALEWADTRGGEPVVLALLRDGADPGDNREYRAAYAHECLARGPELPSPAGVERRGFLWKAIRTFERVIARTGGNATDWTGLARAQLGFDRYPEALASARQALALAPEDPAARETARRAERLCIRSRRIASLLQGGYRPLRLRPVPVSGSRVLWAVLCAQGTGPLPDLDSPAGPTWSEPRLAIFEEANGNLRQVGALAPAGDPRFDGPVDEICLHVHDLTGDGVPEFTVATSFHGASWLPSHVSVFSWRRDGLVRLLGVNSSEPLWIADLNHDGRFEVGNRYEIGTTMCHAEQPRWTDIYAWKGGRYVLADGDFPEQYRALAQCVRQGLQAHPDDYELLKYEGILCEIERRPAAARTAYREAIHICAGELTGTSDQDVRERLSGEVADLRRRMASLP